MRTVLTAVFEKAKTKSIAELNSLADIAVENNYCKPILDESDDFIVKNGRHAVLEKILPLGEYVANDLELKSNSVEATQFMILTGPCFLVIPLCTFGHIAKINIH